MKLLFKAHVKEHFRRNPDSGEMVHVRAHETRTPARKLTEAQWKEKVKHGYASVGADGVKRANAMDPQSGATISEPVEVVPTPVIRIPDSVRAVFELEEIARIIPGDYDDPKLERGMKYLAQAWNKNQVTVKDPHKAEDMAVAVNYLSNLYDAYAEDQSRESADRKSSRRSAEKLADLHGSLLQVARAHKPSEATPLKEPWQMTREKWVKQYRDSLPAGLQQLWNEWESGNREGIVLFVTPDNVGNLHRNAVDDALMIGKPVPPEVLADYPDLQQAGHHVDPSKLSISKRGNAVGFDGQGRTITVGYRSPSKSWVVETVNSDTGLVQDSRRFGTEQEARQHAASLIDPGQTRKLAWWDVSSLFSVKAPSSQAKKIDPDTPSSMSPKVEDDRPPGQLSLFKAVKRFCLSFFVKSTQPVKVPVKGSTRQAKTGLVFYVGPHQAIRRKRVPEFAPIGTAKDVSLDEVRQAMQRGRSLFSNADQAGQAERMEVLLQPHIYKIWQQLNAKGSHGYVMYPQVRRVQNDKHGYGYVLEHVHRYPNGEQTVMPWNGVKDEYYSHHPGTAWNGVGRETRHLFIEDLLHLVRGHDAVHMESMDAAMRAGLKVIESREMPDGVKKGDRFLRPSGKIVTITGAEKRYDDPAVYLLVAGEDGKPDEPITFDAVKYGRVFKQSA